MTLPFNSVALITNHLIAVHVLLSPSFIPVRAGSTKQATDLVERAANGNVVKRYEIKSWSEAAVKNPNAAKHLSKQLIRHIEIKQADGTDFQ